ncbi:unnamed protein product [Choristocarpus tenellus]
MTRSVFGAVMAAALVSVVHGFITPVVPAVRSSSGWGGKRSLASPVREHGNSATGRLFMHTVTIQHDGKDTVFEVDEGTTILEAALENDVDLPHDCKLGVCLTCPSFVVSGKVEQPDGTLEDSVVDKGFALTCCSYAASDCTIRSIAEDELVGAQFSDRST